MLAVRSMIITTSTGMMGDAPQGPLQAADRTVWVVPLGIPMTLPGPYCTVAVPLTTIVLQVLPAAGLHEATHSEPLQRQTAPEPGLQTVPMSPGSGSPSPFRSPSRHRKLTLTFPAGRAGSFCCTYCRAIAWAAVPLPGSWDTPARA